VSVNFKPRAVEAVLIKIGVVPAANPKNHRDRKQKTVAFPVLTNATQQIPASSEAAVTTAQFTT
jgi:hypothetical protein